MGHYLTLLTYIDENEDTKEGLVNFNKMMILGKVLLEIHKFQSTSHPFKPIDHVQAFLLERNQEQKESNDKANKKDQKTNYNPIKWLNEKEVYEQSFVIKPRKVS